MEPDLAIGQEDEWARLQSENIDTILDPMIVRSADLWLSGLSGANPPRRTLSSWKNTPASEQRPARTGEVLLQKARAGLIEP